MIELTRLSGTPVVLNSDLIEAVESSPDTSLLLSNGRRYVVHEKPAEVLERIAAWKRRCQIAPLSGEEALRQRKLADKAIAQER